MDRSRRALHVIGLVAAVFGIATIFAGGSVLFGPPAVRAEAGQVVAFVLQFNLVAGFVYVVAGAAMVNNAR